MCFSAFTQRDYQERIIYTSENDNVCHFGTQSDEIFLSIIGEDFKEKNIIVNGHTLCDQYYLVDWLRIMPRGYWSFLSEDDSN